MMSMNIEATPLIISKDGDWDEELGDVVFVALVVLVELGGGTNVSPLGDCDDDGDVPVEKDQYFTNKISSKHYVLLNFA